MQVQSINQTRYQNHFEDQKIPDVKLKDQRNNQWKDQMTADFEGKTRDEMENLTNDWHNQTGALIDQKFGEPIYSQKSEIQNNEKQTSAIFAKRDVGIHIA